MSYFCFVETKVVLLVLNPAILKLKFFKNGKKGAHAVLIIYNVIKAGGKLHFSFPIWQGEGNIVISHVFKQVKIHNKS